MQKIHKCLLLSVSILLLLAGVPHAEEVRFLTHSLEGTFVDQDGRIRGELHGGRRAFYLELVYAMLEKRKIEATVSEVPFKRGLLLAQKESNLALFNVNRTTAREAGFKWVGPLLTTKTHFYQRKADPTRYQTIDAARNASSICVLNGNQHHSSLKILGFTNLQLNNSYANCINMLLLGRVALTPISDLSPTLQDPEIAGKLQKTEILISEAKGFIAFSKPTPDAQIKLWQDTFEEMIESGLYDELKERYLLPERN